jgi:catechol 2,3-dioxygenase-like lactoylglutathione lyase family enzyme
MLGRHFAHRTIIAERANPMQARRAARIAVGEGTTPRSLQMAELPAPREGFVLTHFIVSSDLDRSRRFYTEVLGGEIVLETGPVIVQLANGWVIINTGGGPTDDKPTVTLEPPRDPNLTSSFLNIRVADIGAVYAEWSARGAEFLTEPKDHGHEIRCYLRDPDGHLIEVGQATGILEGRQGA